MNPVLNLRLAAATLAFSSVAVSACSSSDTLVASSTATRTASGSAAQAEPAPLCARSARGADATSGEKVIRSRGVGWSYEQVVPATYDGGTAGPLVVALGGGGQAGAARRSVDREAIVLVVDGPANGSGWSDTPEELRFVKDLLLRAEATLCFDRAAIRVVGTGDAEATAARAVADMPGTVQ